MATPLDPVLGSITRDEVISDPALRELYFGSTDTPGLINQATRAAQKSYLDQPAILQGTAGLSAQEQQARQVIPAIRFCRGCKKSRMIMNRRKPKDLPLMKKYDSELAHKNLGPHEFSGTSRGGRRAQDDL